MLLATEISTSQGIAKALKGPGLTCGEKIDTATAAWEMSSIYFPHKDEFLLDWLSSMLVKPPTKKKEENPQLDVRYWNLFDSILTHFHNAKTSNRIPVIRVPLILAFSASYQNFHELKTDDVQKITHLYDTIQNCLQLLSQPTFAFAYRPQMEQLLSTFESLIWALDAQMGAQSLENKDLLASFVEMANIIVPQLDAHMLTSANQRKTFSALLGQPYRSIMRVHMDIEKYPDTIFADLKKHLDLLIQNGLFHPDTVMEYPTVLQTTLNKSTAVSTKNQSYAKKLFDESVELLKSSKSARDSQAVLYILPSLLSMFVHSYRKKRKALSMSNSLGNTSSLDIGRTVEFGFFQAIHNILSPEIGKGKASLEVLNRLFQNLLDMNVYHATNDSVAKDQHGFLSEVTAQVFKQLENPVYQGSVLEAISLLLEIDDTLIEPYMSSLWPYMLDPVAAAEKESYVLAKGILNTYAKSRQIGEYIQSLMSALNDYGEDQNEYFLRKPIFSRAFLLEFSACVHNNVPPSQALSIFQIFYEHLTSEHGAKQPAKKRKISKEMAASNERSHRLSIEFLCQFLLSIRLSPQQSLSFTSSLQQTSETFIMDRLTANNPQLATPALQLHQALLTAFSDLYFDLLDATTKDKLATNIQQVIAATSEHSTNLAMTTMVLATNAGLQFSYYSLLRDFKPSSITIENLVNSTLSLLLPKLSKNGIWNGRLIDLTTDNIGTACWKVLAEDWLPTISTLARPEHMSLITSMISADDHTEQQISGHWSIHGINVNILRSAEFYELVRLRETTFQALYSGFVENIELLARKTPGWKPMSELAAALKESSFKIQESSDVLNAISTQLQKIHLFPMEFFNKYHRQHLVLTMLLIEKLSCNGSTALYKSQLALLCRSFAYKLIHYRGEIGFLNGNPVFLKWWITMSAFYYVKQETDSDAFRLYQDIVATTVSLEKLLLSKLIEDASAGNQSSRSNIQSCEDALRSIFLQEAQKAGKHGHVELEFIIALLSVFNRQLSTNVKRSSNRDQNLALWKSTNLQSDLDKFVVNQCKELKLELFKALDGGSEVISHRLSHQLSTFSSILSLSHQLLRQHYILAKSDDQQHSKILGPILGLISPCLKVLQSYVSSKDAKDDMIFINLLKVCAEMAMTICSALPEMQDDGATKRIIAFSWFVYELAHRHNNRECQKLVDDAFINLVATLSLQQFNDILSCIIQRSTMENSSEVLTAEYASKAESALRFMRLLMESCTTEQRKAIRDSISSIIMMISNIIDKAISPNVVKLSLKLMAHIVNDQVLGLRGYDISLILAAISQLRSPAVPTKLTMGTKQDANDIFDSIYRVLSGILKTRKQQLSHVITPFISIVESLMHCFKSLHPSVAISSQKKKNNSKKRNVQDQTFPLLTDHAPLSEMNAHNYSRLLEGLGDQSASNTANTIAGKSHNLAKAFSKHSPYVLAEYLSIQSNPISTISLPTLRSALRPGLFALLDICGEHERDMLMTSIDTSQKMLFKTMHTEWTKTHRYTGR
ncbi:hypothetical protein NQZ79_g420 [Umbelopsis isabellina]|nr:hypothetical protein NQZ79_g420 [Umbelopsis isabellina]